RRRSPVHPEQGDAMKPMYYASIALCCLAFAGCGSDPAPAGQTSSDLVGGQLEPTLYPAMGYLVFRIEVGPHKGELWRPDCGATLIAPNAVLTAAHCVVPADPSNIEVTPVAVGFGDGLTGTTYDLVGTPSDWSHPKSQYT